jgi:RNase H-like domain found in reverse transcriptase
MTCLTYDPSSTEGDKVWVDPERQHSFKELQRQLVSAPILRMPIQGMECIVFINASHFGLGCVLMQEDHVIAYASR